MFSENCSYSLNLVFSVFSMFFRTKRKTGNKTCFLCFPYFPCFSEQKTVFKNCKQTGPSFPSSSLNFLDTISISTEALGEISGKQSRLMTVIPNQKDNVLG